MYRCHVIGEASFRCNGGLAVCHRCCDGPGEAKVGNLDNAIGVEEDIGRFLIPMNHLSGVEKARGREELVHDKTVVDVLQHARFPVNSPLEVAAIHSFTKTTKTCLNSCSSKR